MAAAHYKRIIRLTVCRNFDVDATLIHDSLAPEHSMDYATAIDPSGTADATRLTLPPCTSRVIYGAADFTEEINWRASGTSFALVARR